MVYEMTIPKPGIYRNKQSEYFTWPFVSSSALKRLKISPAHYKSWLAAPDEDTPALRIGHLFHTGVFDPMAFEALDPHHKTAQARKEYLLADELQHSCRQNPQSAAFLARTKQENRELAIVFDDPMTGVRCKALIDACFPVTVGGLTKTVIYDLKSTADASDHGCQKAFYEFGYYLQAAHYMVASEAAGLDPVEFHYCFVEKKEPFPVNWMKVSDEALNDGKIARYKLLRRYQECLEKGEWPGYYQKDRIKTLSLPQWKRKQLENI